MTRGPAIYNTIRYVVGEFGGGIDDDLVVHQEQALRSGDGAGALGAGSAPVIHVEG